MTDHRPAGNQRYDGEGPKEPFKPLPVWNDLTPYTPAGIERSDCPDSKDIAH